MERAAAERRALVIDDDPFVASALAELLSEEGYDVHTASNGFSAVRQAIETRPSVILLDLVLPERLGADVLAELRGDPATHDAAIVIVSGHSDMVTDLVRSSADGVVLKPFDLADVSQAVYRAVQCARARRAEVAPVSSLGHRDAAARSRRATSVRHSRGRR